MQRQPEVSKPNYMRAFQCIGDRCSDTCCAGWQVIFDKRATQSYLTAEDQEIRRIAKSSIKRVKTGRSAQNFSTVLMQSSGACPFQQEDKLCLIQSRMGEKALSKTCSTYPRHRVSLPGRTVEVATLSCPEAARLCLLDREAMKIGEDAISSLGSAGAADHQESALSFLHRSALGILEDERISPVQYIMVYATALTLLRLAPAVAFGEAQRFSELSAIIRLTNGRLDNPAVAAVDAEAAIKFQLGKLMPLVVNRARVAIRSSSRFTANTLLSLNGLRVDSNDLAAAASRYTQVVSGLSAEDRSLILQAIRNYLLNDLIKSQQAYLADVDRAFDALQAAVVRLCIVVLQVIGVRAAVPTERLDDLVPAAMSTTVRIFEHNSALRKEIAEYLDGIDTKSAALLGLLSPRL